LFGLRFYYKNQVYFGISQAFDRYGMSKLEFLKYLLIISSIIVTLLFVLFSFYISGIITSPITKLTKNVDAITPENLSIRIQEPNSSDEVGFLAKRFNQLLNRVEEAFRFQTHFIHHISHELKTPLAVMVTNAEKALTEDDAGAYRKSLEFQRNAMMELSYIINAMMDISKTEHNIASIASDVIRIDELLFECITEISFLHPNAQFTFSLDESIENSAALSIAGNQRMLKMALMNLLKNSISFSENNSSILRLFPLQNVVCVDIINNGATLSEADQAKLFRHLFRGQNSKNIKGFGLGLVLTERIIKMHGGTISYTIKDGMNCFSTSLPLS